MVLGTWKPWAPWCLGGGWLCLDSGLITHSFGEVWVSFPVDSPFWSTKMHPNPGPSGDPNSDISFPPYKMTLQEMSRKTLG